MPSKAGYQDPSGGGRPAANFGIPLEALVSLDSMEGVYARPVAEITSPQTGPPKTSPLPGHILALAVTALAYLIHYLPFPPFRVTGESGVRHPLSAAILAILIGIAVRNLVRLLQYIIECARGMPRRVIPPSIVLTGAGLNLAAIASVGIRALMITLACLTVAMASSIWLDAVTRLFRKTAILIGAGTAICGTSAIVAVAPLIQAEDDMLLAIGTVNILGLLFMFAMPVLGSLLNLSDQAFGVWAGTSIHAVPQVLAAAFSYSQPAGAFGDPGQAGSCGPARAFDLRSGHLAFPPGGCGPGPNPLQQAGPCFRLGIPVAGLSEYGRPPASSPVPFRQLLEFHSVDQRERISTRTIDGGNGTEVNIIQFSKVGDRAMLVATLAGLILLATSLLLIRVYL